MERANPYYDAVPAAVDQMMERLAPHFGRRYRLFEYIGDKNAEDIIVMMGSGVQAAEECIEHMNQHGDKVGILSVRLFRPWSPEHFLSVLPPSVKRITILDRVKESTSQYEPLAMDVATTLQRHNKGHVSILGGRYGLGSKEFTPSMVYSVFQNMRSASPKDHFTVGIVDDVSGKSIDMLPFESTVPEGTTQCIFWGFGGDGTIGSNKSAIKIIGDNPEMKVQAYFAYDAHKSGGVTLSHLRFGKKEQTSNYLVTEADFIGCHRENYVKKYDVISNIKKNGTFVLNTKRTTPEALSEYLPGSIKREIAEKDVKLYVIDAHGLAETLG